MIIEELTVKRKDGKRNILPTGKTFSSFTEVCDYCLEYGSKLNPCPDILVLKFRILDSNEMFGVGIGWDRDKEVYVTLDFPELSK
jgi:hypothetical protein